MGHRSSRSRPTPTWSLRSVAVLAVLVLASLSVSHHLVYQLAYGVGSAYAIAMSDSGHDAYWTEFVIVVGGIVALSVAVAITQLRRLARLAGRVDRGRTIQDPGYRSLVRSIGHWWWRVALLTFLAFLAQENLETFAVSGDLPGLGVVSGTYLAATPLIVLVSLGLALVRALVAWRREVLLARVAARTARPRSTGPVRGPTDIRRIVARLDSSRNGERAPPLAPATPT